MSGSQVSSQLDLSQMADGRFLEAHRCLCNFDGLLADHLRKSAECVKNLRKESALLIVAPDDEVFIVKVTVMLRGCPAPNCPGGGHQQIPQSCLLWWREIGWMIMGWKGIYSAFAKRSLDFSDYIVWARNMKKSAIF